MIRLVAGTRRRLARRGVRAAAVLCVGVGVLVSTAAAAPPTTDDPRFGLSAGWLNAGTAQSGLELLGHHDKPLGFVDPANPGSFAFAASDLALQGDFAFVGNFNGFNIYDISDASSPTVLTSVVCPGGQGDLSVSGNLLFMSVEESRARVDCGTNPQVGTRFQGVRIFDISTVSNPVQVAAVQTCRGSHTHTLVEDDDDPDSIYVYVSGTAGVRPASTLAGCNNNPATGENPSRWRIEVIRVPLAAPETAAVVSGPRLFVDEQTGAIDGLQNTLPTPLHPSGAPWGPSPITDACHDITVFPALELAAGACEGNGLLIDVSDPESPVRIDAVADPNYAYWHGATFSNDGTKVVFTDEWGGGTGARCRVTDDSNWGGNAIYEIVNGQLEFRSYYKLPVAQTVQENCVSHIPSLVPVPGRDIFVQAWYQGGASLVDFTDASNPAEIGYYDRGPISSASIVLGGLWATYWYNGAVYGSEIARGLDVYGLTPTDDLSENEIEAAESVTFSHVNAQSQHQFDWEPSFAVVRSFRDQLVRADEIDDRTLTQLDTFLERAEQFASGDLQAVAKAQLHAFANQLQGEQYESLRAALLALADSITAEADPQPLMTDVKGQLAALAASGPPKLADKADDVEDKLAVVLAELAKTPPDGAAALGNLEGAVGDLQAMVKDRVLTPTDGAALMDTLAAAGRLLAEDAIADAIARGGNPGKIAEARSALAAGDARWAAGRYKDALAKYKDAYAKATGA